MTSDPQPLPRDGVFDRTSLWLRQCEGFRVYTPEGHMLGYVEELRFKEDSLRPETLVVRGGVFGARLFVVGAEEVAVVNPREERIALERSPIDAGFIEELRQRLGIVLKRTGREEPCETMSPPTWRRRTRSDDLVPGNEKIPEVRRS